MNINTIFFVCFRIHIYKNIKNRLSQKDYSLFSLAHWKSHMHLFIFWCIFMLPFIFRFYTSFYSPYRIFLFLFDLVLRYILFDVIIRKGAHAVVNRQGQIKQRKDCYCPGAFAKTHIAVKKYRNIDRFEKHSGRRFLWLLGCDDIILHCRAHTDCA